MSLSGMGMGGGDDNAPSANASWGTSAKPSSTMTNMLLSQVMAGRNNNNNNRNLHVASVASMNGMNGNMQQQQQLNLMAAAAQQQQEQNKREMEAMEQPSAQRPKLEEQPQQAPGIPRTITLHTHLLERGNAEGARLYSYYMLSIDELYRLPPTPSDEEYCARLNVPGMTATMIPGSHLAALSASRFAEIALGAIVNNDVSLGMELCNAVVHCLRESVQEPVQIPITFEVAKAYFLLGIFRALRGDMQRYFKYRRVCMAYLTKIENDPNTSTLLAAVSYLDSWAYMMYNANEASIPADDDLLQIPQVNQRSFPSQTEMKYNTKTATTEVASDPRNKNWIQGAPPVYLNNEAPLHARSLDALACAIRTCCDQANSRFCDISKEANDQGLACEIPTSCINTATATAVMSHENELCSRNMVLSAYTLMQQHDNSQSKKKPKNVGQHLVISAMDAFLENGSKEGSTGFTDSQIQSLLSVCNAVVENPLLLHHAGPTYHMVTNAAVLLCHLLNGMHAMKVSGQFSSMEETMFEEVLDTLIAVRKLLTIHRRRLPVKLRCHGIPRPALEGPKEGKPYVDLGETLLCSCRGCQGFVLMACSPCVAAERARDAKNRMEQEIDQENQAVELGELDRELDLLGEEFNVDDDALLNMISSMIN
eukprot:scaffold25445_cov183-Amphora_coffeaeformis.AAC.1